MNNKSTKLIYPFLLLFFINSVFINRNVAAETLDLENTIQIGLEYDDNIFKTFNLEASQADLLAKLLFKTQKNLDIHRNRLIFGLSFGGKKYFINPEQDTGIGQFDFDWQWAITDAVTLNINNTSKGQVESFSTDSQGVDINESYFSNSLRTAIEYPLVFNVRQSLQTKMTYFTFFGDLPIDYLEGRFGTTFTLPINERWRLRAGYELSLTQFTTPIINDRDDKTHEISTGISYYGPILASLGYSYSDTDSSLDSFSSSGHRLQGLVSFVMYNFTLHMLGSLQLRSYPAVFISDEEGQRLLFSESEESNFNTLTIKLTKSFSESITGEMKFSRYTNEFSDREDDFDRKLFMLGIRSTF